MSKIVSIHSFRGGTSKSNLTANLAAVMAQAGHRVRVIDTDVQSPGIHVLFGLDEQQMDRALNDYLWGKCSIQDTAYDASPLLNIGPGQVAVPNHPFSHCIREIAAQVMG
jgi:septum site-determining protein MinD